MPRPPLNTMDRHIGRRIRQRRTDLGVSQVALANFLDISFQQLQKYEAGRNRISASMLHNVAYHLQMPIGWFFALEK